MQEEDVSLCGTEEDRDGEELLLFVLLWYITEESRIVEKCAAGRMGIFNIKVKSNKQGQNCQPKD